MQILIDVFQFWQHSFNVASHLGQCFLTRCGIHLFLSLKSYEAVQAHATFFSAVRFQPYLSDSMRTDVQSTMASQGLIRWSIHCRSPRT